VKHQSKWVFLAFGTKLPASGGVKVLRYEIADYELPATILMALEKQMQRRAGTSRRCWSSPKVSGKPSQQVDSRMQETIKTCTEADKAASVSTKLRRAREIQLIAERTAEGSARVAEGSIPRCKDRLACGLQSRYVARILASWPRPNTHDSAC